MDWLQTKLEQAWWYAFHHMAVFGLLLVIAVVVLSAWYQWYDNNHEGGMP